MTRSLVTVCAIALMYPQAALSESSTSRKVDELKPVALKKTEYNNSVLYLFKPNYYLSFNFVRGSSKSDYGPKFTVLKKEGDVYKTVYESRGAGDAYSMKPSFFRKSAQKGPLLILAEEGTEYSWGVRVFLVFNNLKTKELGTMEVAVNPDSEFADGPVSVVPFTRIHERDGMYRFTFVKDVIYDPGGLRELGIPKDKINYLYDSKNFKLVRKDK